MQQHELEEYVARRNWRIYKIYTDKGVSGATENRPALDRMMADAYRRHFSAVVVWKFDRFARSVSHLLRALETFKQLGIEFISLSEQVDTSTPAGKMVFTVLGSVGELERSLIGERVRAGLQRARDQGVRLGRPALRELKPEEIAKLRNERRKKRVPFRALAQKYGISVWTAHRMCGGSHREPHVR